MKRKGIMEHIQLANNTINTRRYLDPLLKSGIVKQTIEDRPNNIYQQYVLSPQGTRIALVLAELSKKANKNSGS